jgi:hypothetical protein
MSISSAITLSNAREWLRTKSREEDFDPEATGLLTASIENILTNRRQFATDQRMTSKKDLIASKRKLRICLTPIERYMCPMFDVF